MTTATAVEKATALRLRQSIPMVTSMARRDLARPSSFAMATLDVLGGETQHLACVMVWGDTKDEAQARAQAIEQRVNSFDPLVEALAKVDTWLIAPSLDAATIKEIHTDKEIHTEVRAALALARQGK